MIIHPDQIITGDGVTVLKDYAIYVKSEKIVRMAHAETVCSEYPEEEVYRCPGATLLPGLCDMHTHIGYFDGDVPEINKNDGLLMLCVENKLKKALEQGVVCIRDMASPENVCKNIMFASERKWIQVPEVTGTGAGMCITGGHFYHAYPGVVEVDGADQLVRAVRERIRDGYRWIKLMTTDNGEQSEYTLEELYAAVQETHRLGGKITVHATNVQGIELSIQAGVDGIEHASEMTEEQADRMVEQRIAWTPTMIAYKTHYKHEVGKNRPDREKLARYARANKCYREHFADYFRKGIHIVAGTDFDGMPVADELLCMVELGITPLEAVRTATYNCALLLERHEYSGLVAEGYDADLLIVQGDVSRDITVLKNTLEVILHGKPVFQMKRIVKLMKEGMK